MSVTAAKLMVEIGGDTSGAESGMLSVSKGLKEFGDVGSVAIGGLLEDAIQGAVQGFINLGTETWNAYADFERLGDSLQQMSAKEAINSGQAATMGIALSQTAVRAQELQGWVQKLAIQSPFNADGVASAFRMSMAYGFNTEQAKRMTQALVDFSAGSGASSATMERVSLALGQIGAKGKLAGGEVLQLTEAGLNVDQILAKAFNKTTAEIVAMREKGLIPAGKAIELITQSLENDFGGAAARQSSSIAGLTSSLEDIKQVGLREFFTSTFEAIQPKLVDFTNALQDPRTMLSIQQAGKAFGDLTTVILDNAPTTIEMIEGIGVAADKTANFIRSIPTYVPVVINIVTGGIVSLPNASGNQDAEAQQKRNELLAASTDSYLAYEMAVVKAGNAAVGLDTQLNSTDIAMLKNADTIQDLHNKYGMLTEAEYRAAQVKRQSGTAWNTSLTAMNQYSTAVGLAAQQTKKMTASFEDMGPAAASAQDVATALKNVQSAQEGVQKAEQNWLISSGNAAENALKARVGTGQLYRDALSGIDNAYGTALAPQQRYNDELKAITNQYARTGDVAAYQASLKKLGDEYGPLQESIKQANLKLLEFKDIYNSFTSKTISITIVTTMLEGGSGNAYDPTKGKNGEYVDPGTGSGYSGKEAMGGLVYPGQMYWVGEQGPEPFIPAQAGRILSVNQAQQAMLNGGGASYTVTQIFNGKADAEDVGRATRQGLIEAQRAKGRL